jgi:hypothetical protein
VALAEIESTLEQIAHAAWEADGSSCSGFEKFLAATQQVPQTLLVPGFPELVIRRPAVVDQQAGVVAAEQTFDHLAGAVGMEDVSCGFLAD